MYMFYKNKFYLSLKRNQKLIECARGVTTPYEMSRKRC